MSTKLESLIAKLEEIFQMDKPELDFGIYRIMHACSDKISDFLENRLKNKVVSVLNGNENDTDGTKSLSMMENEVYAHLLTFFSRYYDKGDFISLRRYKGDAYAIPYSGEEVKLHWANSDQYYIKSGENFSHYDFSLPNGAKVHFRLVAAELTKDNIKDNDAVRCFVLWDPAEAKGAKSGTYPESAIEEKDDGLYIYFQYKRCKKGTKQAKKSDEAVEKLQMFLNICPEIFKRYNIWDLETSNKDKRRTIFRKYLDAYTAKNTSDYFIHKDLHGFLSREIDFYIKNEMMHLDDIQHASSFSQIANNLRVIQAVRAIAMELITFMAQIENFQKKLWLKKKFILESNWCISMCFVPRAMWEDVLHNNRQLQEWKYLFKQDVLIDSDFINTHENLVLDTQYFSSSFKDKLINELSKHNNLDDLKIGEILHGDNFHCLKLLENKYKKAIQCVYIDPPYNSPSSEVLYKNSYKHSSWLSLIDSRMDIEKLLLSEQSATIIAIDKYEHHHLFNLCTQNYTHHDIVSIAIEHNKKGVQGDHFSFSNEYAIFCISNGIKYLNEKIRPSEEWEYSQLRNWGAESERSDAANCFYPLYVKDNKIIGFGEVLDDSLHPTSANEIQSRNFEYYEPQRYGKIIKKEHIFQPHEKVIAVWPIDSNGIERKWRYAAQSIHEIYDKLRIKKSRLTDFVEIEMPKYKDQYKTVWSKSIYNAGDYGTKLLTNMGIPKQYFSFPKSVFTVKDCIHAVSTRNSYILDYFAGSGTTAQAVMLLNQEDDGNRKFILCEMGDYFNKVTLPRVKKSMYAPQPIAWNDGYVSDCLTSCKGILKYCKIESYDDALNNIELRELGADSFDALMHEEYLLKYMLDIESRDSIINTDSFRKPFDYKLKIAVDSSGASEMRKVDLVETFNYLLGIHVQSEIREIDKGFVFVNGEMPNGKEVMVIWRDCDKVDNDELNKLIARLNINPANSEFDCIYVNGDHNIPNRKYGEEGDAPVMKVVSIESEFLKLMFE